MTRGATTVPVQSPAMLPCTSSTKAADGQVPAGAGTPPTTEARAAGLARAEDDSRIAPTSASEKAKDSLRIEVVVGRNPAALRASPRRAGAQWPPPRPPARASAPFT